MWSPQTTEISKPRSPAEPGSQYRVLAGLPVTLVIGLMAPRQGRLLYRAVEQMYVRFMDTRVGQRPVARSKETAANDPGLTLPAA